MPRIAPVHWKTLEKLALHVGCRYLRTVGDHAFYGRKDLKRPVVFPKWREVPVFIIKNNLKTLGLSRESYFSLLQEL